MPTLRNHTPFPAMLYESLDRADAAFHTLCLRATLDLASGGRIARDLHDLYGYVLRRMTFANLKNDVGVIDECIRLLQPVRDAWNAIEPGRPVAN